MRDLAGDVRFGVRMLLKRRGTSALAAIALALGIGLTTTMFSIIEGVILRGLPFDHADRIVYVARTTPGRDGGDGATADDYLDWQARQRTFEGLAASRTDTANVFDGDTSARARLARVTPNLLRVLHAAPLLGRDFVDADGAPGAPAVAIIGYGMWESRFGREASTIGRTVRVNGTPTTIIGVMPERFGFPESQDLWQPLSLIRQVRRGDGESVDVVGRLRPGMSLNQAAAELRGIAAVLAVEHVENKDVSVSVEPYVTRRIGSEIVETFSAMMVAVFGVMLIACVNVANLQLARAAERQREVAVRTALGAGRRRILRQLLIEGLLLAVAGALLGLVIATVAIALFNRGIADTNPPFWIDIRIDVVVLAFTTGLTMLATLAGSLVPALRATRQDVNAVLKDEGRGNTGLRIGRFGRGLVVAEVLLSCCLLVVSGLMIKSIVKVSNLTYPYRTSDVFMGRVVLSDTQYRDDASRGRFAVTLAAALDALPGFKAAALATGTPYDAEGSQCAVEGRTYPTTKAQPWVRFLRVTPGFLDVLGVSVLHGRGVSDTDTATSAPVAVVSASLARTFPDGDALGRRVRMGTSDKAVWRTIVGVVPDMVIERREGELGPDMILVPLAQDPQGGVTLLGFSGANPSAMTAAVRRTLAAIDPDLALADPGSIATSYERRAWPYRVFGSLFLSFGVGALVLASAGLYGVMAFSVRQRTQEIGVRMALGADRGSVLRLILWQGLWRVGLGIALGLGPAWLLARAMKQLMFNVTATDPLVLVTAVLALGAAGFFASLVPALRAAAVDPLTALRHD